MQTGNSMSIAHWIATSAALDKSEAPTTLFLQFMLPDHKNATLNRDCP
jgi:hypothetical protein